jgi:hypothetical protein
MNPFNFGTVAEGRWFVDREKELHTLKAEALSGGKVLLLSPRRYGKTSLAYKVMEELRQDSSVVVIYLDTIACVSLHQWATRYSERISKELESTAEKLLTFVKELLPSLRPQIQISSEGEMSLQIGTQTAHSDATDIFEKVLDFAEKAAVKKRKRVIVILDEFQALLSLDGVRDGPRLLWAMRSKIQHHRHVSYILAGSQKHLLEQMTLPKESPFFRMLTLLYLGKIPEPVFSEFIGKAFRKEGLSVAVETLEYLIDRAGNVPYYVLNLSHEVYAQAIEEKRKVDVLLIDQCVGRIVQRSHPQYEREWELLSGVQRNVLRAVADGQTRFLSGEIMEAYGLRSIGGVQKSLRFLTENQYLVKTDKKYEFDDQWFRHWIWRQPWPSSSSMRLNKEAE